MAHSLFFLRFFPPSFSALPAGFRTLPAESVCLGKDRSRNRVMDSVGFPAQSAGPEERVERVGNYPFVVMRPGRQSVERIAARSAALIDPKKDDDVNVTFRRFHSCKRA